jgi:hypothetical protein
VSRSFLLTSDFFLLPAGMSAKAPTRSALSAAARQILRMVCAASMSPIGHSIFSSQTSVFPALPNHHIALPQDWGQA